MIWLILAIVLVSLAIVLGLTSVIYHRLHPHHDCYDRSQMANRPAFRRAH